jgi:hypothetical protein
LPSTFRSVDGANAGRTFGSGIYCWRDGH